MRLTKQAINALAPQQKGTQRIIWDSAQGGLGLRSTSGSKSFVFQGRLRGQTVRVTIGAWPDWSVDLARERARELAVMIDRGIDPRAVKVQSASVITLQNAYEQYTAERQLSTRTRSDYDWYLDHYLSAWKPKALDKIDSAMVVRRYQEIAASKSGPSQASSAMRFLRAIYNFAQATHGRGVIPENPVAALTARRAWIRENKRKDHLRQHEIRPFVLAVRRLPNPVMAAYIEFVLLTGARRREASGLRWSDVDARADVLTFMKTKNHTDRPIPITPRVAELLDTLRALRMGGYVFAVVGKDGKATHLKEPRKALNAANKAAASRVTVQGLRRTFATILESLDCPAYPLKALLGHSLKGDVTTAHYAQLNVERLRPWLVRYEQRVLELLQQAPATAPENTATPAHA